jgi:hypothetical protein
MIVDMSTSGHLIIGNRFNNMSAWHYLGTTPDERLFHQESERYPKRWLKEEYPWVDEVQLFAATGGSFIGYQPHASNECNCEFDRDLFKDPADFEVTDDYEFSPLIRACQNILDQGLRPILKLHGVPIKLSEKPYIAWFRMNVKPPYDYQLYVNYIKALAEALCTRFGFDEVSTWRWFIGTEMENRSWWDLRPHGDDGIRTAREYLKFYDWSVFALESVLGDALGEVGAHAMMAGNMTGGYWDPEVFIAHCREGVNHATERIGTRLDTFAISVYDYSLTRVESLDDTSALAASCDLSHFEYLVNKTRALLERYGYDQMPIEVSEGGILYGSDRRWLWHGLAPGGIYDASWAALSFKKMLQLDVARWSRWPLFRSSGLFHGPKSATTVLMEMIHRMQGSILLATDSIEGHRDSHYIAAFDETDQTIRILVFTHRAFMDVSDVPDRVRISLSSLPLPDGSCLRGSLERIDAEHGDFWPMWLEDRRTYAIGEKDFLYSSDQVDVRHALISSFHKELWDRISSRYEQIADSRCEEPLELIVKDRSVDVETMLSQQTIEYYTLCMQKEPV